jgi:MFS family permease
MDAAARRSPPRAALDPKPPATPSGRAWAIALAGMVSLAVAMGIGRFAFTPLLPMMLGDQVVDLQGASWLASANYLAYVLGALLCTLQPWLWSRIGGLPALRYSALVRAGLVATALVTAGMALPLPATWSSLRAAAGVASAVMIVFTASWCLARLAKLGAPSLGGVIFAGPGVGIVLSGLLGMAMVARGWSSASAWLVFGLLAAVLGAAVWRIFQGGEECLSGWRAERADRGHGRPDATPGDGSTERSLLAFAYGLAGFGYIVTATFLPVIAREALPGAAVVDLFWPIFGVGIIVGALLSMRLPVGIDRRHVLATAYGIQALGIAASLWSPTIAGFAIGSLLAGAPFTVITLFAMQEARRLRPSAVASYMGLLTTIYGIGQVIGPPMVAFILARSGTPGEGFTRSLAIAATALAGGAAMHLWMTRRYPIADIRGIEGVTGRGS